MKTTQEERDLYKESRRLRAMTELVKRLDSRIARSKGTLVDVKNILKRVSESGCIPRVIQSIREAN